MLCTQCCHGDSSGVRHVYHGHLLHYYEASKNDVAMATVVMGDTCVQSVTAVHRLLCW